ncbi:hypothetical protein PCANC_13990 [Puccinia coronata f. sp. avenae]|uniref:Prokaryotic-type class I peptide chain release factors domain-containing protein n=1 Tax=Puccinia coronata f. sp. avenae TaxID=200324 RepID=A0A2N5UGW3_9BASI|nr:hypothetical protein PCANC_13990 [Puccinia coronata f. sp. avenae]
MNLSNTFFNTLKLNIARLTVGTSVCHPSKLPKIVPQTPWHGRVFSQSSILLKKKRAIPAIPPLDENELVEQFVRGSGPGGQAVNKTNNAVSLIHKPTGIRVQAHTHRSREANRNQARRVLAERVDYYLNKGRSKIEKMWERERKKKLAKARKQKKSENEKLELVGKPQPQEKPTIPAPPPRLPDSTS